MPPPPITIVPNKASRGEKINIEQRGGVFPIECEYCGRPYPPEPFDTCRGCAAPLRRPFIATDPGRPAMELEISGKPIEIA